MNKAIVVARYNENLDWLNHFKNFKIYHQKLLSLYDRDDCIEMGYVLEYFWTFLFKSNGLSEADVANCLKL